MGTPPHECRRRFERLPRGSLSPHHPRQHALLPGVLPGLPGHFRRGVTVPSHRLRRRTDRLTLLMAALTTLLIGAAASVITHPEWTVRPDPAHVCHAIPGTSRLDCR